MNYQRKQKQLITNISKELSKGEYKATTVDIRKDYENDHDTCLTSVVFPDKDIKNKIVKEIINPLREIEPEHYYCPIDSLHLTIKNIRTINTPPLFNDKDVRKAKRVFKDIVPKFKEFPFCLKELVQFPTSISLVGYSDKILYDLVHGLDQKLKMVGVPDNKKYISDSVFFGSLTVCRFTSKPSERFLQKVKELQNLLVGDVYVKKISLITCNSVCSQKSIKIIETYNLK